MTTNPPPSSDNTGMMAKAGRWLRKPSTLGIVGGIVLAGTGLYLGGQQLAYRQASPFLASELSRLLGRPVQLGDVEAVGFFQIVFGSSTMPATALDPTTIALEAIEVSANPWLFLVGQPLEIETTLVRPRLTLKQDKAGKWTTFELPKGEGKFELPVDIDAKVTLQAAQISLLPYGLPRPLVVTADGQVSYQYLRQDESQTIGYDLDIALASSQITAKGETAIATGKSETSIRIDRLDLPQLARLLPPSPVKVQSGTVAGEVNASLPSWTQIGALQTLGNLKLSQLQARLDQVQAPLKADFKLNLVGQKLIVEQGRFELGPLKTEVQGAIAWNEGYNLSAITNAVEAKTFSQTLNLNLPVAVDGRIKAQLQVRGPLANPQLQGRLDNVGPVRVDQVVMDAFRTDFRADLDTLTVPHFRVQPQTGGTIQGRAQLNWQLRHLLTPAKAPPWRWQTIPIQAQLTGAIATQPLLATYHIQPEQVNIGNLNFAAQATGTLSAPQANLEWRTDQSSRLTGVTLATRGQANLVDQQFTLKDVEIRSNDGNVRIAGQGNLRQNRWQLQATTQQFPLTPFIQAVCELETTPACPTALRQKPLTITAGRLELMGELTPIDPSRWQGSGQLQFRSQTETAQIATRLEGGQLQTNLVARHLAVNPYVPQLTTPITLDQFTAQAQLPLGPLLTGQFPLQQLSGHSQLRASINHQPVTATTHISQGQLETQATLGNISLNALAPQLPVPALVDQGKISVAANMSDLLQPQPDLRRLEAIATVALTVAGGEVTSVSRLDNLAWRSQITAQNLALPAPDSPAIEDLTPINAQVSLAGHLKGLFSPSGQWGSFPITVQKSQVTSGDQQLTAQGTLVLGNLAQQPELSQVDLALQGDFNLAQLPVNAAIAQLPMAADLKPASLDLVGKTQFVGNLTGQGVTDVKDLQLVGQVTVNQLAINDYAFEPRLTGPLSTQVGQPINLDLQGEVDQLAFNLQPCRGQCFSPYLPTRFRLRQAYNRPDAIIAQGQLNGDRLTVDVDHFPLAILNVRPARRYNIPGRLAGDVQAQMTLNLRHGNGRGNVVVNDVAVGYLKVDQLTAEIAYQNQLLQLDQGQIMIGGSRYNARGALNLNTQAIEGTVSVKQAQISKLLTALRVSNVDSLLRLVQLQPPPSNQAGALKPINLGNPDQALENQLNLLYLIDQQIIALAQQYEKGGLPQELNIVGTLDADIDVTGTLNNPGVAVNVEGKNWSWYPQAVFPNVIPPLGLVLNETRFLPIQHVKLQARLRNGQLSLLPSFVDIKGSRLAAEGTLSPQDSRWQWQVKDFDSDILAAFFQLPGAVAGRLNAQGEINGPPTDPQLSGVFTVDEITLNARPVAAVVGGQFNYQDHRLQVVTSEGSPLYFNAQVPVYWPPKAAVKADQPQTFRAALNIPSESLALLDVISQEQLVWLGGNGRATFNVEGELSQANGLKLENVKALGQVTLEGATIKSAALPTPVQIDGEIYFNNSAIAIPQLTGKLAQSQIEVAGVLPLFTPQASLDNPLQISIKQTRFDLPNLYTGTVAGLMTVEGAALQPIITGDIQLTNGQVFLPNRAEAGSEPEQLAELRTKLGWFKPRKATPFITPTLDNLKISLRNLYLEQAPLYEFSFGGDLKVSGPLLDVADLSAEGAIQLSRGRVSFLDTRFLLDRRSPNTIVFRANQDLLNPNLNIAMRTIVSDLPQSARLRSENTNEYPDDSLNQIQRVDVRLLIDGNLSQILPNLNPRYAAICDPTVTFRPLPGVGSFDEYQLGRLSKCLQILAAKGFENEQVFSNPAITLTSSPPRSEGEIVRLLGEQVIVLVDALQGKNSSQLLQVGITQLAIPMIFQGLVYDVETAISDTVASTDFRIVPFLEAIYEIDQQGYLRLTYDYSFNEFRVRYEKQFD